VTPSDPKKIAKLISEAVQVAKRADVVVLAIVGERTNFPRSWS